VTVPLIEPASALAGAAQSRRKQATPTAQNFDFNSASVNGFERDAVERCPGHPGSPNRYRFAPAKT
jgi:hypothetical protein